MAKYEIIGGTPLSGEVVISGAKNAVVAILPAALLVPGKCRIENVPDISDVRILLDILRSMGAVVECPETGVVEIDCSNVPFGEPNSELVRKLRASYYLLGAQLGRYGKAHVALPGGCAFAARPINLHIEGFETLGADVTETEEYVEMVPGPAGLQGAVFSPSLVSVGATINIMLAACRISGTTIIEGAAREPHVVDLANFLNTMGARISGAGTDTIKIRGVESLHGGTYAVIPDQIEAGTYMAAAVATGGDVLIKNVIPKHMECISIPLRKMGAVVTDHDDSIRVQAKHPLSPISVKTMPYPGFPTDMQAQICVCMVLANNSINKPSKLTESVYETRFFGYCTELENMGARITIKPEIKTAFLNKVCTLKGTTVHAKDLRAGAALIIAGLSAEGTTYVKNIHYVERGYERIIEKLTGLGAKIRRIED